MGLGRLQGDVQNVSLESTLKRSVTIHVCQRVGFSTMAESNSFRSVTSLMAMGAAKWSDLTFREIIQPVYISTGVGTGWSAGLSPQCFWTVFRNWV